MSDAIRDQIARHRIIAIARGIPARLIVQLGEALLAGGVRALEVTFDHAHEGGIDETLKAIALLSEQMKGRMLVGAGTVLTPDEASMAADAGAQYIISPNVNPAVIARTKALGLCAIPGAMTPTEVVLAHESGADLVKLFPAGQLGPSYIKALHGPLAHIPLLATGGIKPDNIGAFLRAGAMGAGVGGNLCSADLLQAGDTRQISELAAQFVQAAKEALS